MQSKNLFNTLKQLLYREKVLLTLGVLFISCVFSPYLIWGEDTHLFVLDNMEANLTWVKMILDAGGLLPPNATINQVMNGIPLSGVYGVYDFNLLLFKIFGIYKGYAVSKYLVALIGFFGMYLFLKRSIIPNIPLYIAIAVALCFSLLPFWSFTASIAGIPLVIYAFMCLRKGDRSILNWLILVGYAFYSSLVLTGVFVLLIASILFVFDIFKHKRINTILLCGLICLTIAYIISHLPLFYTQFDSSFVSVREEFTSIQGLTIADVFKTSWIVFLDGDDYLYQTRHFLSMQRYFIIPTVFISLILMAKKKILNKFFLVILSFIVVTSIMYAAYETFHLLSIRNFFMRILPLNLSRICWLHPVGWYTLFAMSCIFLTQQFNKGKYYVSLLLIAQLVYILPSQEPFYYRDKSISFASFFAEEQFSDIRQYLGEDTQNYRVISLALHPTISQYNRFYTLDGYMINYPLDYKHQFRKIIAGELDRSSFFKKNFDEWGGRCYAWSSEVHDSTNFITTEFPEIQLLDFDYNQIKSMGGKYIFSTAKINTTINTQLQLLKKFAAKDYRKSNWNIYVYRVL